MLTNSRPSNGRRAAVVVAALVLCMAVFVVIFAGLGSTGHPAGASASVSVGPGSSDEPSGASAPSPATGAGGTPAPGASNGPAPTVPPLSASIAAFQLKIAWVGSAAWQLQHPSAGASQTAAFADAPSYLPGDTFRLAVSTTAARYTVAVYRVGPDMRRMSVSAPQRGVRQPDAVLVDKASLEVRAPWSYTYSQKIPTAWPSGIYLAKVTGLGGADAYAIFTVRSQRASKILFVQNFVNDEAYNAWGGTSLYVSSRGTIGPAVHHASAVSLDRPFATENGAAQVFEHGAAFAVWLERAGYDVTYTTDYDLATHPDDQPLPKVVLFSGHDEYWGVPLRDWLDLHVLQRGDLSLGLFAANTGFWPASFRDASATGPRTVVVYKEASTSPNMGSHPAYGADGRPKLLQYRNLPYGDAGPGNRPEQLLFGVEYGYIATRLSTYTLASTVPAALLAGTNLRPGDPLGMIVGGEVDFVHPSIPAAPGDQIVAGANGISTRHDVAGQAQAALRDLPSGGRVFAAGTFYWEWGLQTSSAKKLAVPAGFERLTKNIIDFLARG